MLKVDGLTPADNADILSHLANDATDDQVCAVAQELLGRMASEPKLVQDMANQVRRVLNVRRDSEIRQAAIEASKCYIFARLHRSATPMHPVYEQLKVYARDFGSFCKANGLSEKDVLKVAAGELAEHRGWRQGMFPGSLGTPRTQVVRSKLPGPAMVAVPFGPALPTKGRSLDAPAAPVFLPAKVWQPAE
jgi:hypothetical protein